MAAVLDPLLLQGIMTPLRASWVRWEKKKTTPQQKDDSLAFPFDFSWQIICQHVSPLLRNCSYPCLLANLLRGLPVVCGLWVKRLRFDPLNKALSRQCLLTDCFWSCLFQIMVISVLLVDGSNRCGRGRGDLSGWMALEMPNSSMSSSTLARGCWALLLGEEGVDWSAASSWEVNGMKG